VLFIAALAIWAVLIERQLFVVRQESIKVLPKGSDSFAVLQIGDIHLAPWQRSKQRFIKGLTKHKIDLVVNTGDNLGHTTAIPALLECLEPLLQKPGVFVNGSNDYYAPVPKNPISYIFHASEAPKSQRLETTKMTSAFEQAGWINLNNQSADIEVAGNSIRFIGVDDYHIGKGDLSKLAASQAFTIGVTHAPYLEVLRGLTLRGAELIFAGHTHGGQVRVPFIGALTTNSDLPNKFARGTSGWSFEGMNSILSVVAGLGNSIYAPVRFLCRPEVRLITLLEVD
jgi:predicted MPP superfamily phosphohydrolase